MRFTKFRICSRLFSLNKRKVASYSLLIGACIAISLYVLASHETTPSRKYLMNIIKHTDDSDTYMLLNDKGTLPNKQSTRQIMEKPRPLPSTSQPSTSKKEHIRDVWFGFLNDLGIVPLIIEPTILNVLKRGDNLVREDIVNLRLIGIFHTQAKILHKLVISDVNLSGSSVISRKLPTDVSHSNERYATCFTLRKGAEIMKILVVYFKESFVYIPSCFRVERHYLFSQALLGETPIVFDRFNLRKIELNGVRVTVPSNVTDILIQFPSSHYHECRRDMAGNFTNSNETPEQTNSMLPTMVYMKILLKRLGRLPFLAAGTLLGWYRQCHFIRGSGDIDMALFSRDLDTRLHSAIRNHPNITGYHYNLPKDGYQYYLFVFGERLDLFFLYDTEQPDTVYSGQWAPERERLRLFYPRSEICSGVLLGHRFNIPCRIETLLLTEYGESWKIRGDYGGPIVWPLNYKVLEPWSDELWKKAFMNIKDKNDVV